MRLALLTTMIAALAGPIHAQNLRVFSVGSGELDGGYFATVRALCAKINKSEKGRLRCSPESTPGSVYNLVALRSGQLDLALVQSDWQKHAFKGTSFFASQGPLTALRSVMSLYVEPANLVARADAGIAGFRDLIGKRVDVGPPSSGTQATMRAVAERLGIKFSDFRLVTELPAGDAVSELCAGRIDAMVLVAGHPSAATKRAIDECGATLVSLADPEIDGVVSEGGEYDRILVPRDTYGKLREEVRSFGVRAILVALSTTDGEIVGSLVRNVLVNLEVLRRSVPALAALDPQTMRSKALAAPLHPAAAREFDRFISKN